MNTIDNITELCATLENINYQIAELSRIKEALEAKLNDLLEHGDEGSKTYVVDKFKITVKSGYNYTLDKEEYEIVQNQLQDCFNPVKRKISYELDKKVIRDCEKYGNADDLMLLSQIVSKKPSKLNIRITAAC